MDVRAAINFLQWISLRSSLKDKKHFSQFFAYREWFKNQEMTRPKFEPGENEKKILLSPNKKTSAGCRGI
jgi:hypothetical protein